MDKSKKFAYVTALTSFDYLPGLKALKKSLKKCGSLYPLVVLVPDEQPDLINVLKNSNVLDSFCILKTRTIIRNKNNYSNYWDLTFFKIMACSLVEYEKIILIDLDMLINRNIDHLFEKPSFSAVIAGKISHPEWNNLSSGLMVLEPSLQLTDNLISIIDSTIKRRNSLGLNAGDQDVFIDFLVNWKENENLHLSEEYNCFFYDLYRVCNYLKIKPKLIFVIHFIGAKKPWMMTKKELRRLKIWFLLNKRFSQYKFLKEYMHFQK